MDCSAIALIRAGFEGLNPANVGGFCGDLIKQAESLRPGEVAAYLAAVTALDAAALAGEDLGKLEELAKQANSPEAFAGPEGNLYYLGVRAVSGSERGIEELVRRARHRDGSTTALVTGHDAIGLLDAVKEPLAAEFKKLGFDPSDVKVGNFPDTAAMLSPATPPAAPRPAAAAPVVTIPLPPVVTAPIEPSGILIDETPIEQPRPPASALPQTFNAQDGQFHFSVNPDFETGEVIAFFSFGASVRFSLLRAELLSSQISASVRALLIPAEGYIWLDELGEGSSSLVILDPVLAKSVDAPERSGELAERQGVAQVWLQGEILQQSDPAAPNVGQYVCRLFKGDGSAEVGRSSDFRDAKRVLAKAAAKALPGGGA